jgi:AcrR family transcriptional regulator
MLSNGVVGEKVDPRVLRTRKLLIDAFVSLQAEKAFDDITIQDIATRATVNRATFYAHFQDKYDLLDDIIREGFGETLRRWIAVQPDTTQAHLRHLLLAVIDHLTSIQNRCQRSFQTFESLVEAQIKKQLREHVQTWLAAQLTLRAVPKQRRELAATLISWSIYGAAFEWLHQTEQQSVEAFAEEVLPLIAATITALGS